MRSFRDGCDGERRAYLLRNPDLLSKFFPASFKREKNNRLLLDWSHVKLLPPAWYAVVYQLSASPGRYTAVPEHKLAVDGYPVAQKALADPERLAGFTKLEDLRLVLFPQARRFFWHGLHELLQKGEGPGWAICGVGLLPGDANMARALREQVCTRSLLLLL